MDEERIKSSTNLELFVRACKNGESLGGCSLCQRMFIFKVKTGQLMFTLSIVNMSKQPVEFQEIQESFMMIEATLQMNIIINADLRQSGKVIYLSSLFQLNCEYAINPFPLWIKLSEEAGEVVNGEWIELEQLAGSAQVFCRTKAVDKRFNDRRLATTGWTDDYNACNEHNYNYKKCIPWQDWQIIGSVMDRQTVEQIHIEIKTASMND